MSASESRLEVMQTFITMVAESLEIEEIGYSGLSEVSNIVLNKLLLIIQEARKSYLARNDKKLRYFDIETSFSNTSLQIPFGISNTPKRDIQMGNINGKRFCFAPDRSLNISRISSEENPLVCRNGRLHGHWLTVDGVICDVPENIKVIKRDETKTVQETMKFGSKRLRKSWGAPHLQMLHSKYLKRVVHSCISADNSKRMDAFSSLSSDTGLQQNVSFILNFVAEGIRANLGTLINYRNLVNLLLIIDSLLSNHSVSLERYLEGFFPEIVSCVVCSKIGYSIEQLIVRSTAAKLIARIARVFDTPSNHLHVRISLVFAHVDWSELSLFAIFGVMSALCELGRHVVRAFLLPSINVISERLTQLRETELLSTDSEKVITCISDKIKSSFGPIIHEIVPMGKGDAESFRELFGFFGPVLYSEFMLKTESSKPTELIVRTSEDSRPAKPARIRAVVISNEDLD